MGLEERREKLAYVNNDENNLILNEALNALTAAFTYIDKLIFSIKDALLVTTPSGTIITLNQAALELFEYSQEDLILQEISIIFFDKEFLLQSENGCLKDCEVVCQTRTGRKLVVTFTVVQTEIENLQQFVYIGRDITQQKRNEQLQGVEHTITSILASSATVTQATTKILSAVCSNLEWEWSEFWSINREVKILQVSSTWHKSSENLPELVSQQNTFSSTVELRDRIWTSGEPVWINVASENLHTAFGFPIKCGSEIIGVMTFFSSKIQDEQSDLLKMMAAIGSQIGQFISRCQAEEALRESEERFKSFMSNSPAVAFMKDSHGCYVYANNTCERVFNIQQSDLQLTLPVM